MILTGVLGTNGSGKTTLIRRLMTDLAIKGKRSAVIVNEHGLEEYGDGLTKAQDFTVEGLRGG